MANSLATIEVIHSIREHGNADALEIGMIRGFQVVVKKGEYNHGDKVVFVWPDTLCPSAPWNAFLDKKQSGKPIKIKSCKLRGEYSTGLVLPVSAFPEFEEKATGDDVSLFLGVEKYLKDTDGGSSDPTKGPYPTGYISRSDEDLAQSTPAAEAEFHGLTVYLSLKIDGQSLTFIRFGDDIHVCSRNLELLEGDGRFWSTVRKYGIIEKTQGMNIAIQGEQYGPGIQKNPLMVEDVRLAVFNIKDLGTGKYYTLEDMERFCQDHSIPMVPILERGPFTSFAAYQDMADRLRYDSNKPAEGIVVRPVVPVYSPSLGKMLSVKFVNRNYSD